MDSYRAASTHARGARYEAVAARHLQARGWAVLDRNVRFARKEIDLIVSRDDVVAFVEVKGRRGGAYGDPLEAITLRKRREIETVARWWIERQGGASATGKAVHRFDAVAVREDPAGGLTVEHVEDAWRPGWR